MTFADFPGGLEIKNLPSNAGGKGSIPGQGTRIPQAMQRHKIEKPECHMDDPTQRKKKKTQ